MSLPTIGRSIRTWLARYHLSVDDLAATIYSQTAKDYRRTIQKILSGETRNPRRATLQNVAAGIGVSLEDLTSGPEDCFSFPYRRNIIRSIDGNLVSAITTLNSSPQRRITTSQALKRCLRAHREHLQALLPSISEHLSPQDFLGTHCFQVVEDDDYLCVGQLLELISHLNVDPHKLAMPIEKCRLINDEYLTPLGWTPAPGGNYYSWRDMLDRGDRAWFVAREQLDANSAKYLASASDEEINHVIYQLEECVHKMRSNRSESLDIMLSYHIAFHTALLQPSDRQLGEHLLFKILRPITAIAQLDSQAWREMQDQHAQLIRLLRTHATEIDINKWTWNHCYYSRAYTAQPPWRYGT